jgi:hypothetical protein
MEPIVIEELEPGHFQIRQGDKYLDDLCKDELYPLAALILGHDPLRTRARHEGYKKWLCPDGSEADIVVDIDLPEFDEEAQMRHIQECNDLRACRCQECPE